MAFVSVREGEQLCCHLIRLHWIQLIILLCVGGFRSVFNVICKTAGCPQSRYLCFSPFLPRLFSLCSSIIIIYRIKVHSTLNLSCHRWHIKQLDLCFKTAHHPHSCCKPGKSSTQVFCSISLCTSKMVSAFYFLLSLPSWLCFICLILLRALMPGVMRASAMLRRRIEHWHEFDGVHVKMLLVKVGSECELKAMWWMQRVGMIHTVQRADGRWEVTAEATKNQVMYLSSDLWQTHTG